MKFYQFSFRWMNCLLAREVHITVLLRLWDTCFAECDMQARDGREFEEFFVYLCAALLCTWSAELQARSFVIMFSSSSRFVVFVVLVVVFAAFIALWF